MTDLENLSLRLMWLRDLQPCGSIVCPFRVDPERLRCQPGLGLEACYYLQYTAHLTAFMDHRVVGFRVGVQRCCLFLTLVVVLCSQIISFVTFILRPLSPAMYYLRVCPFCFAVILLSLQRVELCSPVVCSRGRSGIGVTRTSTPGGDRQVSECGGSRLVLPGDMSVWPCFD